MRVCLDTNVLIRIFVPHPPFDKILDAFLNGQITLIVSNEILFEYHEVVIREFGSAKWRKIDRLLTAVAALHQNVSEIDPHFRFGIVSDPDDNKFTDCAMSGVSSQMLHRVRGLA